MKEAKKGAGTYSNKTSAILKFKTDLNAQRFAGAFKSVLNFKIAYGIPKALGLWPSPGGVLAGKRPSVGPIAAVLISKIEQIRSKS